MNRTPRHRSKHRVETRNRESDVDIVHASDTASSWPPRPVGVVQPIDLISLLMFALALTVGCAWSDGQPWGRAELSASIAFEPPPGRLTQDGLLRTSSDYGISLESFEIYIATVEVNTSANRDVISFNPARPPAGYSLCHNGHCHTDDGRIVDYADVEIALAGAQSGSGSTTVIALDTHVPISFGRNPITRSTPSEPKDTYLQRGSLSLLTLTATQFSIRGRAFDLRDTTEPRLPQDGRAFEIRSDDFPLAISRTIEGEVDRGQSITHFFDITLDLTPTLFDRVPFNADVPSDEVDAAVSFLNDSVVEQIAATLQTESELSVTYRQ